MITYLFTVQRIAPTGKYICYKIKFEVIKYRAQRILIPHSMDVRKFILRFAENVLLLILSSHACPCLFCKA